jgi:hypothetical protein
MRRNQRPVPDAELAELARVVEARVSDPDIIVPSRDVGDLERPRALLPDRSREVPADAPARSIPMAETAPEPDLPGVDGIGNPPPLGSTAAKAPSAWTDIVEHLGPNSVPARPLVASTSGGRRTPPAPSELPRYLSAIRDLVVGGGWIGTMSELSSLIGEKPEQVFADLRAHRSELASYGLVVTPVETEDGWRWAAFDRHQLTSTVERTGTTTAVRRTAAALTR